MAIYYVDYENGNDSNNGTTFALRKKSVNSVTGMVAGDTIRVMASPDPILIGDATWTNKSTTVTIPQALTIDIDNCSVAWTPSASVTSTLSTTIYKEGAQSVNLVVAAAFTTGVIAYRVLPSNIDLRGKQQISFWFRSTVATTAGSLRLDLCSDSAASTAVHTFQLPATPVASKWVCMTLDNVSELTSTIRSVRLVALTDPGAATINIDNIIACNAPGPTCLTLNTLIGKNTEGETFYGIQSISGTTIKLDNDVESTPANARGYVGVTETVPTYLRQTIKPPMATAASTALITPAFAGSSVAMSYVSGGWDRTDMSTQTGETWFDGQSGSGYGLVPSAKSYYTFEKLNFVRFYYGANFLVNSRCVLAGTMHFNNNSNAGFNAANNMTNLTIDKLIANNNNLRGFVYSGNSGNFNSLTSNSNKGSFSSYGVSVQGSFINVQAVTACNNEYSGLELGTGVLLKNLSCKDNYAGVTILNGAAVYGLTGVLSGNTYASFTFGSSAYDANVMTKELTSLDPSFVANGTSGSSVRIFQQNADGTIDNHKTWFDAGVISSHTGADRRTPSGLAWSFKVTGGGRDTFASAIFMNLAKVAVVANKEATISVWAKRTGGLTLSGRLFGQGGLIRGVDADITTETTAALGEWEQLTLKFTPTETGVMSFQFQVSGTGNATNTLFIDDFSFSQVA